MEPSPLRRLYLAHAKSKRKVTVRNGGWCQFSVKVRSPVSAGQQSILTLLADLTPSVAMIAHRQTRPISWIGAARKDFETFPKAAQDDILAALTISAGGGYPANVKPMKGLGPGVYEVALRHRSDAYRAVYVLRRAEALWVVHAFKKKSASGIKTPRHEIELIGARIKRLEEALG